MAQSKKTTEFILPVWRLCNLLMSAFFALATYVQINDPDAGLWMVGYAVPAGLCLLIPFQPEITGTAMMFPGQADLMHLNHPKIATHEHYPQLKKTRPWRRVADLHVMMATGFGAMLGWTLYKEGITHIFQQEEGREFCGLMLTVLWLLLCRHSGRTGVGVLRLCTAVGITVFPFVAWIYYYINKELTADWPSHCTTAL